jgi:hypothetical protein
VKARWAICTGICNAVCTFAIAHGYPLSFNGIAAEQGGHMIARGKRRGVPPLFAPAGPVNCRIGTARVAASEPRAHYRARGPPGESPDQDRDAFAPQGRPTIPSPDMLLGQRSDPASPAVNQAPARNNQIKESW